MTKNVLQPRLLLLVLLLSHFTTTSQAFIASPTTYAQASSTRSALEDNLSSLVKVGTRFPSQQRSKSFLNIRGGSQPSKSATSLNTFIDNNMIAGAISTLNNAAMAGPFGVASLWAVASSVVVPLTLRRQGYAFSVGYGFSIMGQAIYLSQIFKPQVGSLEFALVVSAAVYGGRLGLYLLQRELSVPSKAEQVKSFDKSPPLKRVPFAASVSSLYAFLMTPCLYALRGSTGTSVEGAIFSASSSATILLIGTVLAWSGVVLEAVADYHKFYVKQKNAEKKDEATSTTTFVGPTGGVYRITRHPNYTGEVLFWFGQLVGGVPFLGKSVVGWICSLLGFYGIYSIMTMASKRLDKRQQESYSGQSKYDEWRKSTKASIFPFVNDME